jgi:hypothetical protein
VVKLALETAARSPCLSKRGVVAYITGAVDAGVLVIAGAGYNSPPAPFTCPGRARCAGNCGKRCVHAEMRALRAATAGLRDELELVHVGLAADGGVVACDGPSCWQCAREVLDVGFVAGVWLYLRLHRCMACRRFEDSTEADDRCSRCPECGSALTVTGVWRRYTAEEFYRVTLERCGMAP